MKGKGEEKMIDPQVYKRATKPAQSRIVASSDVWDAPVTTPPTSDEIEIIRLRRALELIQDLLLAGFPRAARCIAEEVLAFKDADD